MIYVGIDVGITNLAIVKCLVEEFKIIRVLEAHRIDLGKLKHVKVSKSNCKLHHTNDAYDRIQHFLQEYDELFQNVDQVRIERQPITGLVHIEQLLFGHFRSKAKLVSPNAMHRFFNIQQYDYEGRKQQTIKIARPLIESHLSFNATSSSPSYNWNMDRVHDMADALCLVIYALHIDQKEHEKTKQIQIFEEKLKSKPILFIDDTKTADSFFEQFRFTPVISSKDFMNPRND